MLLLNSIFESDIMREAMNMVDPALQALQWQQLPDWNEGNLLSVNIQERNDKAITACLADWRGETGYFMKDTNQYQAHIETDYKMGNVSKWLQMLLWLSDLMENRNVNVELWINMSFLIWCLHLYYHEIYRTSAILHDI